MIKLNNVEFILLELSKKLSNELGINIRITQINDITLEQWQNSWCKINQREPPNGGWNWNEKIKLFDRKYLITIALWESNELCGLAIITRSKRCENLSIHYIEGSPNESHKLKGNVFKIIEIFCQEYCKLSKKTKLIRIIEPTKDLIDFYNKRGYFLKKKILFFKRAYCEKKVEI